MMKRWLLGFIFLVSILVPLIPLESAHAAPFNRSKWRGYFFNHSDIFGDDVMMGGICRSSCSEDIFISQIRGAMNSSGNRQTGAEFIVLTMLGYRPGTSKSVAHQQFAAWERSVRYYSQGHSGYGVNYHSNVCYNTNTYWQGNGGGGSNPDDVAWYSDSGCTGHNGAITFYSPGGSYSIRKLCANPVGDLTPLGFKDWALDSSLAPGRNTPSFGGTVQPGQTYHLTPTVRNTTSIYSDNFVMEVNNLDSTHILNAGISSSGSYDTRAVYRGSCVNDSARGCWHYEYGRGVPGRASSTQNNGVSFTVAPNTPVNTRICFSITVDPSNSSGGTLTRGRFCFVVAAVTTSPSVIGQSGDVHAGGALCGSADLPGTGNVTGGVSAGSKGEYVLSASGDVSGFGSDNGSGSGATLGRLGNYFDICRPDIVAGAIDYINGGGGYRTITSGQAAALNLGDASIFNQDGVYLYQGGDLTITGGNYTHKITLVVLGGGNVHITGPVQMSGSVSTTGRSQPSVGIVAANDILVAGSARRVDAYMFSNGTIDTCLEGTIAACGNTLIVNGFLMSKDIKFSRTGTSSNALGERINLTGQLYLNPPVLFGNLSVTNLLEAQGERPPLN